MYVTLTVPLCGLLIDFERIHRRKSLINALQPPAFMTLILFANIVGTTTSNILDIAALALCSKSFLAINMIHNKNSNISTCANGMILMIRMYA